MQVVINAALHSLARILRFTSGGICFMSRYLFIYLFPDTDLWFDVYCRRSAPYKWLCMYVCSAATDLRGGGSLNISIFLCRSFLNLTVKKLWKLVNLCRSYSTSNLAGNFWHTLYSFLLCCFLPRNALHSAVFAVVRCLYVFASVHHMPVLCLNG